MWDVRGFDGGDLQGTGPRADGRGAASLTVLRVREDKALAATRGVTGPRLVTLMAQYDAARTARVLAEVAQNVNERERP